MKDFKIISIKIPDFDKLNTKTTGKTDSGQFSIKELALNSLEAKTTLEKFLIKFAGIVIALIVCLLFSILNSFFV